MDPAPASSVARTGHRRTRAAWLKNAWASLVLCGPAVLLYAGFIVLPALLGFGYSLTDWNGWKNQARFVGLENFREMAGDQTLWDATWFTLFETALIVVFFTFGALVLAVLLDRLRHWKGLIRGLFFYPYILSVLVAALLFRYLANYDQGAVNVILRSLGLEGWTRLWDRDLNLVGYYIFAMVAWSSLGFFTTLYLANLQTIPTELYEAAAIDGAGALAVFWRIQLPMLMPTILTNSVLALIFGINLFSQIVVTTHGGPGKHTFTLGYYIYDLGVLNNRQGYASAVSFVCFVALVIVAVVQVGLMRRRQVEL